MNKKVVRVKLGPNAQQFTSAISNFSIVGDQVGEIPIEQYDRDPIIHDAVNGGHLVILDGDGKALPVPGGASKDGALKPGTEIAVDSKEGEVVKPIETPEVTSLESGTSVKEEDKKADETANKVNNEAHDAENKTSEGSEDGEGDEDDSDEDEDADDEPSTKTELIDAIKGLGDKVPAKDTKDLTKKTQPELKAIWDKYKSTK